MKRKNTLSNPKPVEEIEVSGKHTKLKIVIVIVAVIIALVSFGTGIATCMSEDRGWKALEVNSGADSCGGDFVCYYYLEKGGQGGKKLLDSVTNDYSEACVNAYRIFNAEKDFEGVSNLATLSKKINTEVMVNPVLYSALGEVQKSGTRALYLAPIYTYYYNLFYAFDDSYAAENDPRKNTELAAKFTRILSYANSGEHISLELLGENKVKLNVSEEYAAFFKAEGYGAYLDFFILKNAFIIDYISDFMTDKGHGTLISSFDGYTRSSLAGDKTYTLNVFDFDGKYVNPAASVTRGGKVSAVRFRDYGTGGGSEFDYYYTYTDGVTVTPYLNSDGLNNSCLHNLLTYSYTQSCARVMLESLPVYTADELADESLKSLKTASIYSLYCAEKEVRFNDAEIEGSLQLVTSGKYSYTKKYFD